MQKALLCLKLYTTTAQMPRYEKLRNSECMT
jgi:hypothetical protein